MGDARWGLCSTCGRPLGPGWTFCGGCGGRIRWAHAPWGNEGHCSCGLTRCPDLIARLSAAIAAEVTE